MQQFVDSAIHCVFNIGHDWSKYIEFTVVDLEGDIADGAVERREKEMMEKIKNIIPCDITQSDPFQGEHEMRRYDIIQCSNFLEIISNNVEMMHMYTAKLASYVKPGGYLQILCGIGGEGYSIPGYDRTLHILSITPEDLIRGIEMAGEKF